MKAIIESGKVNGGILSCFIMPNGIEIVFQNNDLTNKFALSLIPFGISCTKNTLVCEDRRIFHLD